MDNTNNNNNNNNIPTSSDNTDFKLYLVDLQSTLCKEFIEHFKEYPNVEVHNKR